MAWVVNSVTQLSPEPAGRCAAERDHASTPAGIHLPRLRRPTSNGESASHTPIFSRPGSTDVGILGAVEGL